LVTDAHLLRVDALTASYGPVVILRDVSFDLVASESLAILGANGAGKTTLIRAICGLLVRRQGRIVYDGIDISGRRSDEIVRFGVSQVPEGRHLFPPLSVIENLRAGGLPLALSGRGGEVEGQLDLVFDLFPRLKERREQTAGTLSGGEQQMLAIGRALMSKPRVLLLDEPSVGLAPKVIESLFAVLHKLKASGLTLLLAEQNVALALELSDRALLMRLGRVALAGTAAELKGTSEIQRIYLGG
jgi:branched-chain amino acid transport system ATP-binding protein